jgi:hypothetical protein
VKCFATTIAPGPLTAKPSVSLSKAKWDMAKGYDNFFNGDDSDGDNNIKIEDGFDDREHL